MSRYRKFPIQLNNIWKKTFYYWIDHATPYIINSEGKIVEIPCGSFPFGLNYNEGVFLSKKQKNSLAPSCTQSDGLCMRFFMQCSDDDAGLQLGPKEFFCFLDKKTCIIVLSFNNYTFPRDKSCSLNIAKTSFGETFCGLFTREIT